MTALLIWWTCEDDCRELSPKRRPSFGVPGIPGYLREQYSSRFGRSGRGRLWVDRSFGTVAVDPWPDTPLATRLGNYYAGIVIAATDLKHVKRLPGIVTDLNLRRVG